MDELLALLERGTAVHIAPGSDEHGRLRRVSNAVHRRLAEAKERAERSEGKVAILRHENNRLRARMEQAIRAVGAEATEAWGAKELEKLAKRKAGELELELARCRRGFKKEAAALVELRAELDRLQARHNEVTEGRILSEWSMTGEVERLRAELHEAQDDARFRAEAEAASKADRAEVERLRAEATGEASRAMMLEVDLENARAERDEVFRWLRQWRADGWRPATPEHDRLVEWLEAEEGGRR